MLKIPNHIFTLLLLLSSLQLFSQTKDDAITAQHYFDSGDYKLALPYYKKLLADNSNNTIFYQNLLKSYIKLKDFSGADSLVKSMISKFNYRATLNVDLGYVYKKQGKAELSDKQYKTAIEKVRNHPNLAYSTSYQFQNYLEPRWALRTLQVAENYNPKLDFNIQKANLYGELGMVDSMLYGYFNVIEMHPNRKNSIQRYLSNFLKQNSSSEINQKVKNILLFKTQETHNPVFSELLLWFFTENKDYNSAFTQAQSLYKRNYANISTIQILGEEALKNNHITAAEKCFIYIRQEATEGKNYFLATQYLLELQEKKLTNRMSNKKIEEEYKKALQKTALNKEHFNLILSYARFVAFNKYEPQKGLEILEKYTKPYKNYDNIMASKYLLEGDIYLLQQEFTKSFLAYQKAETFSSEEIISDEAKFKTVKVSYYKGDFGWAMAQSRVLKKSLSKWYANDAADLFMLLQNSFNSDSSNVPIKLYVKADLLKMQSKNDSSFAYYNQLIQSFPNHYLVPNAMLFQSEILEEIMAYNRTVEILKTLYNNYPNNNLSPIVLLRLSEVYLQKLKNKEEAKIWLKELMVKFPNSPQAKEAREIYREIV